MERNIPSLPLVPLVFFFLSAPPCAATSGLSILKVVPISSLETWDVAQSYCRWYHNDLVSIRNQQEADKLAVYEGWIGLRRKSNGWRWSDEGVTAEVQLYGYGGGKHCIWKRQSSPKFQSDRCSDLHPFLCDERLILVQENKTWEEALLHCRELQAEGPQAGDTTYPYDLASLPGKDKTLLDTETIRLNASTHEVWVGQRFLAGEWLWMSGRTAKDSKLSQCPAQQQHCAALVPDEVEWKIMNCSEKRNFLCAMNKWKRIIVNQ